MADHGINAVTHQPQDLTPLLKQSISEAKARRTVTTITRPDGPMPKIMEEVLLAGDLAKLTPQQRVSFYGSVCQSLGMNPLTKPFDYLNLNGKLTLYAGKAAAEQLRVQHNISVKIVGREVVEGVYVVTTKATTPAGREDESTGAVVISGLSPADRANAYMKAETKAKRRVTLSICGLGMLDDSEIETIRGASRVPVNMETGEIGRVEPVIDTGGQPVNTQAAANAVRDRKLAELRQPQPKGKDFGMLKSFKDIKPLIGSDAYYRILASKGFQHANEIPDASVGKVIWMEMEACRRIQREGTYRDAQPIVAASQYIDPDGPEEIWPEGVN